MLTFTEDARLPLSIDSRWQGGEGVMMAQGDFGGGTLTLEFSLDGGTTWTAVGTDTTLTASGGGIFGLVKEARLSLNLSGSTAPSINASVDQLENP